MKLGTMQLLIVHWNGVPELYLQGGPKLIHLWRGVARLLPIDSPTRARVEGRLQFADEMSDANSSAADTN